MPAAQPFIKKYKDKYDQDEGAYSVYGYDAANVLSPRSSRPARPTPTRSPR